MMSSDMLKDPLFVELLGAFIGDGWIEKRGTAIYICGSPTEDKWHYDNFLAPVFSKYFTWVQPRLFPYWGVYGICSYQRKVINRALAHGFRAGDKARTVTIPHEVMRSENKEVTKAIIRGVFDTDGSFYAGKQHYASGVAYTGRISIGVSSQELFNQLLLLFSKMGFSCRTSYSPPSRVAARNNNESFRIMINKQSDIDRFFIEIGSNNLRHVSRYLLFKKLGYLPKQMSVDERLSLLPTEPF